MAQAGLDCPLQWKIPSIEHRPLWKTEVNSAPQQAAQKGVS